uniref:Uncharacterized protein n=2 Tax=Arundo donax TaxID=35708 RepID=A0A0A9EE79_ARUDO
MTSPSVRMLLDGMKSFIVRWRQAPSGRRHRRLERPDLVLDAAGSVPDAAANLALSLGLDLGEGGGGMEVDDDHGCDGIQVFFLVDRRGHTGSRLASDDGRCCGHSGRGAGELRRGTCNRGRGTGDGVRDRDDGMGAGGRGHGTGDGEDSLAPAEELGQGVKRRGSGKASLEALAPQKARAAYKPLRATSASVAVR